MMQPWGHTHVSCPFEVYAILARPPRDRDEYALWKLLLTLEPPIWGAEEASRKARALAPRRRVWTWDDEALVYSPFGTRPPDGLHYRRWAPLDAEADFAIDSPRP